LSGGGGGAAGAKSGGAIERSVADEIECLGFWLLSSGCSPSPWYFLETANG
jgi:hypothetical protein